MKKTEPNKITRDWRKRITYYSFVLVAPFVGLLVPLLFVSLEIHEVLIVLLCVGIFVFIATYYWSRELLLGEAEAMDAKKQAEVEFTSISYHQLATPLGGMRWNLELLLEDEVKNLPKHIQKDLKEIYELVLSEIILLQDFLNVTRIDQGRVKDEPEPTDVYTVVSESIEMLKGSAEEKQLRVVLSGRKRLPKIVIDRTRLRQVMHHLISNAIKYTKDGAVSVDLSLNRSGILFTVADTGIGIPPDARADLYGRFFRARNAVISASKGTGLGLYVAKAFIEGWGGKIWYESQLGEGTTFYVQLPLKPININPPKK